MGEVGRIDHKCPDRPVGINLPHQCGIGRELRQRSDRDRIGPLGGRAVVLKSAMTMLSAATASRSIRPETARRAPSGRRMAPATGTSAIASAVKSSARPGASSRARACATMRARRAGGSAPPRACASASAVAARRSAGRSGRSWSRRCARRPAAAASARNGPSPGRSSPSAAESALEGFSGGAGSTSRATGFASQAGAEGVARQAAPRPLPPAQAA